MKKFIASLLCAAMVVTLFAGCSKSSSGTSDGTASGGASGDGGNIVRYTLTTTPQIDPGVGADLVRLSVGLESKEDLIADLEQALAEA